MLKAQTINTHLDRKCDNTLFSFKTALYSLLVRELSILFFWSQVSAIDCLGLAEEVICIGDDGWGKTDSDS